ncbi:cystine/glutamate transporter-like [Sinocyclocheilus grahami]|uniref:cystine/glutamate transporter-like n=1 Tax=Sinocyclocheilus grahami TaxID=75366 RepID=UPI0007AC9E61|nr:PREDICTED: cystine/glutamate transporter-like [Sinocyclocheilus grahami]
MFSSGALCYAELGTSFRKSGGHYTYLLETLGPLPAFLRLWTEFIFIRPAVATYVSLAFGQYVVEPLFMPCAAPTALVKLVSMLGVTFVVAMNCWSVSMAARTQVLLTFIKMFALILIIIPGIMALVNAMIHIRRQTPLPAVLFLYPLVIIMMARGEIFQLINFASFSRWLFIALATLGMIIHRYRFPDHPRPFKVPLAVPVVFTIVCFFIVGLSLYSDPWNTGGSCALTLSGVPVYYLTVKKSYIPERWKKAFSE